MVLKPLNDRTSFAMSRVGQKRTTPEDQVAALLREMSVRYRRNVATLPGSPDFANQAQGWVIQVHGCFWHQHDCRRGTLPIHNREGWSAKFARNKARDAATEAALRAHGLRVLTIWECETKNTVGLKEKLVSYLR